MSYTAQNEAKLLQSLRHDNIVRLMAVVSEDGDGGGGAGGGDLGDARSWGSINLVEELVGPNLWDFVRTRGRAELGWPVVRSMAADITSAVAFLAANGIVHHDVKPHNLLVRAWARQRHRERPMPRRELVGTRTHTSRGSRAPLCAEVTTRRPFVCEDVRMCVCVCVGALMRA
jgi:serine/threonine protein kinase